MDNPDTHPSMMLLKVKIDATKLSIPVETLGELASYMIGQLWSLSTSTQKLGPHIEPIKDAYGVTVGHVQVQNGKQPFPD